MIKTQQSEVNCEIKYRTPVRYGKKIETKTTPINIEISKTAMKERTEFVLILDPTLNLEDVAGMLYKRYGNFLCRHCGNGLVFNGQNGAGTPSLRCNCCEVSMSIWNTYELTNFKYKKILYAMLSYFHSDSINDCSKLYGIGAGLLNEVRMNLPVLDYSNDGKIESVEKDGLRYGITTIDMMYKGHCGLMLGVSGGMEIGVLGNENTGEGMDEFFDKVKQKVKTNKHIFIMDMRFNVARKILEKFGDKAIIVLQSHSLWGDVFVYFYREGWHTLHIRTDAFTEVSKKSKEEELLSPGEFELYEGLKKINPKMSLDNLKVEALKKLVEELITKIENTNWNSHGRIDLVMHAKISKLNSVLKIFKKMDIDITEYINEIKDIIETILTSHKKRPGKKMKQKIVNSWRGLTILEQEVNQLSEALLKKPLESKSKKKSSKKKDNRSNQKEEYNKKIMISCKPKLIYRGNIENQSIPEAAKWILELLKEIFDGKEITNNHCEGRFGGIGLEFRKGRSMYLDRALTKVFLRRLNIKETLEYIVSNYPIKNMGKRGKRRGRTKMIIGQTYSIVYRDRTGSLTERTIDVKGRKKDKIFAYCHLREDNRTFRRHRIKSITAT